MQLTPNHLNTMGIIAGMQSNLPPEYLCCDPGSFAANTLAVRLPEIARRVLIENRFPETVHARVEALLVEMRQGRIETLEDPGAPDSVDWVEYLRPHLGKHWPELSFFVCESLFYRRILAATGYFQPGLERSVDPYQQQKNLGLETSREALQHLAGQLGSWESMELTEALAEALESNLWGNRADLSLWPAGAEGTLDNRRLHQAEEFLVVNNLAPLVGYLAGLQGGRVDFLVDNAGFELASDLACADLLLARGVAREVRFHLKWHPTFVSDAMEKDVRQTAMFFVDLGNRPSSDFGVRLFDHLAAGRLLLRPARYWNSPLLGWEMPEDIRSELAGADLVISKGDANFRRLVGDLRWPPEESFARICAYFPTRLAALRVDKSEVAVGLLPGRAAELDSREPDWRTNGRWGMIHFS